MATGHEVGVYPWAELGQTFLAAPLGVILQVRGGQSEAERYPETTSHTPTWKRPMPAEARSPRENQAE